MYKTKKLFCQYVLRSLYSFCFVNVLLTSCTLLPKPAAPPPVALQAQTPDQAVRRSMSDDSGYIFLAQRPVQNMVVVFYRYPQPRTNANMPEKGFGYTVVAQEGNQWSARGSGGTSGQVAAPQVEGAFSVLDVPIQGNGPTYTAVLGDIQQSNVSQAKAQFTDGTIIQEAVTNGGFVIMSSQPNAKACQLQLLDQSGHIFGQFKLADC